MANPKFDILHLIYGCYPTYLIQVEMCQELEPRGANQKSFLIIQTDEKSNLLRILTSCIFPLKRLGFNMLDVLLVSWPYWFTIYQSSRIIILPKFKDSLKNKVKMCLAALADNCLQPSRTWVAARIYALLSKHNEIISNALLIYQRRSSFPTTQLPSNY